MDKPLKSIIYYTNNWLDEPIGSIVRDILRNIGLPIVSVSLNKPVDLGKNIVFHAIDQCHMAMIKQIVLALDNSNAKYVFFCEHDVLYPKSHFDFTPPKDDMFYYNENIWRWDYPRDRFITYNRLISLSSLCANLEYVRDHFHKRVEKIKEIGMYDDTRRDPGWSRLMGYEPGTKKTKRGGFDDSDFEVWRSELPIVDIRHRRTHTPNKVTLSSFVVMPTGWKETTMDKIEGWNLKEMFHL